MSLTGALNNAVSGLAATARSAGLVSSNIANALTEGYGRRELSLSSDTISSHGGVRIGGVQRHVDPVILADRRLADAALGDAGTRLSGASRVESLLADPAAPGSLSNLIAQFEAALVTAAGNPASEARLTDVASRADALSGRLNQLSGSVQDERMRADARIAKDVETLNDSLGQVQLLNARISHAISVGRDPSPLLDERQTVVDRISEIVPVRVVQRDRDAIALFTTGGAVLLDSRAVEVSFRPTSVIVPEMTLANGLLSGLAINGRPVDPGPDGPLGGGRLGAEFALRDQVMPEAQARLDAIARDLVERFGAGSPDVTITAGAPGLFTDAGAAFAPADEVGLAGRVRLNAAVAPGSGDAWRLRDGLYATAPGEAGNATLLNALHSRLNTTLSAASLSLSGKSGTPGSHISDLASDMAYGRLRAEQRQSFASANHQALRELELSKGVDTDQELQSLMRIEQLYQANARVVTVIDDLMQTILNI